MAFIGNKTQPKITTPLHTTLNLNFVEQLQWLQVMYEPDTGAGKFTMQLIACVG